eukprot:NODE_29387_length_447_cov_3.590625.p1 GENE.NODE_29387_length_447_cov_3.590625~~NODE_29387_length_447_cov_3.590625.p1  ORF type:complete len:91 (-),score=32.42 NODE_29387_length_447_cov_3.590625:79-351(-)
MRFASLAACALVIFASFGTAHGSQKISAGLQHLQEEALDGKILTNDDIKKLGYEDDQDIPAKDHDEFSDDADDDDDDDDTEDEFSADFDM